MTTPRQRGKPTKIGLNRDSSLLLARAIDQDHRDHGRYLQAVTNQLERGETPTKAELQAALVEYVERAEQYEADEARAGVPLPGEDTKTVLARHRAISRALGPPPRLPAIVARYLADALAGKTPRGRKPRTGSDALSLVRMAAIRDTFIARQKQLAELAAAEDPRLGRTPTERARRDVATRATEMTARKHHVSKSTVDRVLRSLGLSHSKKHVTKSRKS